MHGVVMWRLQTMFTGLAIATILAVCAGYLGYRHGLKTGTMTVQQKWDAERAEMERAHAEEQMKANQRQRALEGLLRTHREKGIEKQHRITALQRQLDDSLLNRPEARAGAGGVPETPAAGVGCTGEGLARGDALFLSRYAADAARLQSALNTCQAAYDSVKNSVP